MCHMKKKLQSLDEFKPMALSGDTARKVTGGANIYVGTGPSSGYTDEKQYSNNNTQGVYYYEQTNKC